VRDNPAINALIELGSASNYPIHEGQAVMDPSHPAVQVWRDHNKALAANAFQLMEQHRIPHHPKLKAQYDRGMLTGPEYAQATLRQLFGA